MSIRPAVLMAALLALPCAAWAQSPMAAPPLWQLYESTLKQAKYIDLTHAFEPDQPVWPGFANARFKPAVAGKDLPGYARQGEAYD